MRRLLLVLAACGNHSAAIAPPTMPEPASQAKTLAFEITDGAIQNKFFRRGPIAVHVLATSGAEPRLLFAFPAGNTGAGLWFGKTAAPASFKIVGELDGVDGDMRGVTANVVADTDRLEVRGAVLASIRILRDYALLGKQPAETEPTIAAGPPVVVRRTTADGKHHIELRLDPDAGTKIAVDHGRIAITGARPLRFRATALADDEPLTPFEPAELLKVPASSERDLRALAFLAYREKLLAGSWRFLTYFGRDTLMSTRLLMPVLQPDVVEAALGSVLDRLAPDGDVAHEEDIGDFAALENLKRDPRPADLRQPNYDYKMIDDDFMLAPVLVAYFDTDAGKARAKDFLAKYSAALERNLNLVLERAKPYAADPIATNLVALKPGIPVGQWRDSEVGIGNGRYAFDVNVALVPAALDAAANLYEMLDQPVLAQEARELAKPWQDTEKWFRVEVPDPAVKGAAYAKAQGIALPEPMNGSLVFDAISLDAHGKPIPVMHTDSGFVLLFRDPSPEYLERIAGEIQRPFPSGLRTPVGIVVANPAFADAATQKLFTRAHYHGTVVWSWQQALLAAGIERQLKRAEAPPSLRAAQTALWDAIDATAAQRAGELWTWDVKDGKIVYAPFGQGKADADEANAVQLWSTVYLGVHRPSH